MSRPHATRSIAALVAAVSAVSALTTGCGAGFDATARQSYAPADGIQASSGDMRVLNALVVAPEDGGSGVVLMAVVNRGEDTEEIASIETDAGSVDFTGSSRIEAGETILFGAGSDPSATVRDLTAAPGETVTVKVSFGAAEPINLRTVVVPATGDYESVTLPPEPSPSPTASGPATPSETASPASASPSPSDG